MTMEILCSTTAATPFASLRKAGNAQAETQHSLTLAKKFAEIVLIRAHNSVMMETSSMEMDAVICAPWKTDGQV